MRWKSTGFLVNITSKILLLLSFVQHVSSRPDFELNQPRTNLSVQIMELNDFKLFV